MFDRLIMFYGYLVSLYLWIIQVFECLFTFYLQNEYRKIIICCKIHVKKTVANDMNKKVGKISRGACAKICKHWRSVDLIVGSWESSRNSTLAQLQQEILRLRRNIIENKSRKPTRSQVNFIDIHSKTRDVFITNLFTYSSLPFYYISDISRY